MKVSDIIMYIMKIMWCMRFKNNSVRSHLISFFAFFHSPLWKWVIAWDQTKRARVYGMVWGGRETNMVDSKVKCSGVKTAQNSQTEGGDERKKHENVKLKEEDVPGASLPREKPEECTVKQLMNRTQVLNKVETVVSETLNLCAKSFWNKLNLSLIKVKINSS